MWSFGCKNVTENVQHHHLAWSLNVLNRNGQIFSLFLPKYSCPITIYNQYDHIFSQFSTLCVYSKTMLHLCDVCSVGWLWYTIHVYMFVSTPLYRYNTTSTINRYFTSHVLLNQDFVLSSLLTLWMVDNFACFFYLQKMVIEFFFKSSIIRVSIQASRLSKFFHAQLSWAWNFNCSWKLKYRQMKKFLALNLSDVVFILLINVKMPTIVFMSRVYFVLSWVEHGKSFITSGPDQLDEGIGPKVGPNCFQMLSADDNNGH